MSNALRSDKKNSKFMMVIMGLLMLGLTGFGIGGLGGGTLQSIGSVGDEKIPVDTYARAYRNAVNQLSNRAGRNLSPIEVEQYGIGASVLDAVIGLAAVDNEATQMGLSVGDDEIRRQIAANPNFQGLTGGFEKDAYEYYLDRQLGLTPTEFDTLLRKQTSRQILESSITSGISSSGIVPKAMIAYVQETRDFEWAWVTALQLETPITDPTDAQLQSYYDANIDKYQSLRSRNVTYGWLSPDMLLEQVSVDEAQLRESFELQSTRFNRPEQRSVERLVFGSLQEANDAKENLEARTLTFEQLVTERGLSLRDIDLGDVEITDLSTDAGKLIFAGETLGVMGPVQSSLGPALFRVNAVLAAQNTPFEDVREELTAELAGEGARRLVSDMLNEIDDLLVSGATIADLGKETQMQTGTIDFDATSTGGLNGYDAFRNAVLTAKESDFPEIIDLSDGGIFTVKLNSITEPAPIPFEQVKTQVTEDWKTSETLAKLQEIAAGLKEKLITGESFADLGLTSHIQAGTRRNGFFEGMPPETIIDVFAANVGDVISEDAPTGVLLAQVNAINSLDPDTDENALLIEDLTKSLDAQIGNDVLELYTAALREAAGVSISSSAVNAVNAQIANQ